MYDYSNLIQHKNLIYSEVDYVYNTMHPILQAGKNIQIVIRTMCAHFKQAPTRKPIGHSAQ